MMPLGTVLQGLVVVVCLGRATLLLRGVPLSAAWQLGLLLVCAMYAATEAYLSWGERQKPQRLRQAREQR